MAGRVAIVSTIIRFFSLLIIAIAIDCHGNYAYAVGATTPFTTCEAEAGTLAGGAKVVSLTSPPTTEFSSPQLEASGHAYVALTGTGQSVTLTNNTGHTITAINVRECIPDSATGGGITATLDLYVNGVFNQALTLSSAQTWVYETASTYDGMSQSPSVGNPHVFWDEAHTFISGAGVAPGGTITLQQDSTNTAAFYYIDCVDLENPPAALTQPANTLSVTSYGAVANNSSIDNTTAFDNCISAAQSQGKTVWIPVGTFCVANQLFPNGITIEGAGPWYSTIFSTQTGWQNNCFFHATSTSFQNLSIDASGPDSTPGLFAILAYGNDWTINNVWARHTMLTWGTGNNITVENSRVNNSWGDGININNTNGTPCNNVTVTNNFSRGNGDDGIALNCTNTSAPVMTNITYTNNTCVASWWANEMGIYGGSNVVVENNLLQDSVKLNGMVVGVFGNGYPLTNALVEGNTVVRGGSYGYGNKNFGIKVGGGSTPTVLQNVVVSSNTVIDSMFDGINVGTGTGMVLQYNTIISPGLNGLGINSGANMVLNGLTVTGLASGESPMVNYAPGSSEVLTAIPASSYNSSSAGVTTESCIEGGMDVTNLTNNSYTEYNNLTFNGLSSFSARVASAGSGGTIEVFLDSPTGTLLGSCAVPATGGSQTWATVNCSLNAASGTHNVYLVYTSGSGSLFSVQWFAIQPINGNPVEAASDNSVSGGIGTQSCSEGGLNLDVITNGSYAVYSNLNLNNMTSFSARVASAGSGGNIEVYLDSPTGTLVGTCPVPVTGGWQTWTTVNCSLNGASGYHNVYLVFTGGSGDLFNVEWFNFQAGLGGASNPTEAASYNSISASENLQSCSEGGQYVGDCDPGTYAVYNNVNLNGETSFSVRVASGIVTAGQSTDASIGIHLDSPTGTQIGTLAVTGTGGWQTWSTQTCPLSGATGYHNVYLVFSGGPAGGSFNLEWFDFSSTLDQPPAITNGPLSATIGAGNIYNFSFETSGYPAPIFSLTAGSLPPGLTLSSTGVLTGTPTQTGTYFGTVTASNGLGTNVTQNFTITISNTTPATDTPAMPVWGLMLLAALLVITATKSPTNTAMVRFRHMKMY
jgi:hypothetical protein